MTLRGALASRTVVVSARRQAVGVGLRRGAVVALLLVSLPLACGGGKERLYRPRSPSFFGMNAQQLPPQMLTGRVSYVNRSLAEIRGFGARFVRSAVDWRSLEPNPPTAGIHAYRFEGLDAWLTVVSRNGLHWQPIGIGSPSPAWAWDRAALAVGCAAASPPRVGDYAAMMGAIARRYGPNGSFWSAHPGLPRASVTTYEIWNEPNLSSFWCPRPDPAAYARLYLAARDAIHGVDPTATVLVGGLAPFKTNLPPATPAQMRVGDFLSRALEAEPRMRRAIDAVAIHPYGVTPGAVLRTVAWFRRTLTSVGLGNIPMSANEYGWPTRGESPVFPAVSEATRARYLAAATTALARSDCGLIGLAPHTWVSREQDASSTVDWYGLTSPTTGRPYPSGFAYARVVKALERGQHDAPIDGC